MPPIVKLSRQAGDALSVGIRLHNACSSLDRFALRKRSVALSFLFAL
jgi:hypothetical protein